VSGEVVSSESVECITTTVILEVEITYTWRHNTCWGVLLLLLEPVNHDGWNVSVK